MKTSFSQVVCPWFQESKKKQKQIIFVAFLGFFFVVELKKYFWRILVPRISDRNREIVKFSCHENFLPYNNVIQSSPSNEFIFRKFNYTISSPV